MSARDIDASTLRRRAKTLFPWAATGAGSIEWRQDYREGLSVRISADLYLDDGAPPAFRIRTRGPRRLQP